jgi:hypothetical protein
MGYNIGPVEADDELVMISKKYHISAREMILCSC